jgi:hypothetical protein
MLVGLFLLRSPCLQTELPLKPPSPLVVCRGTDSILTALPSFSFVIYSNCSHSRVQKQVVHEGIGKECRSRHKWECPVDEDSRN